LQKDSIKVIVLGCGNRATAYCKAAEELGDAYEIVAAVDFKSFLRFLNSSSTPPSGSMSQILFMLTELYPTEYMQVSECLHSKQLSAAPSGAFSGTINRLPPKLDT
jgi:hypothetical protein